MKLGIAWACQYNVWCSEISVAGGQCGLFMWQGRAREKRFLNLTLIEWERSVTPVTPLRFFAHLVHREKQDNHGMEVHVPGNPDSLTRSQETRIWWGILYAHFLKILCPGHPKLGHQVRSNDPTSYNVLWCYSGYNFNEINMQLSGHHQNISIVMLIGY